MNKHNPNNFPIESLPPIIKNAVLEMQHNTNFPLPLIISSALGAVSVTCQNSVDVRLPIGTVSPCSLYILLIANSGEGKTPVDQFFTKPIREFENKESVKVEQNLLEQEVLLEISEIELKEIKSLIKKNRKKLLLTDDLEQTNLLNKVHQKLQNKLIDHSLNKPKLPRNYKLISSNITPAKIAQDLHEYWPSMSLISDEAASLFNGPALRDLGMLNQLWDGSSLTVDRISSLSFKVKDARLTISLMAQEGVMENYMNKYGKKARNIGFLARCLVAFPYSTKGYRALSTLPQPWDHLELFQQRITDILTQDKLAVDLGRETRTILEFSPEAKYDWINFKNNIELGLLPGGLLSDVDDVASKITNNAARIAALFHFYEGHQGEISYETMNSAIDISLWYLNEFKRLFSNHPEIPLEVQDENQMEQWLINWCYKYPGQTALPKSLISQYGPNQLRKAKDRREYALNALIYKNKIQMFKIEKKNWLYLNPDFFPIPRTHESMNLFIPCITPQNNFSSAYPIN